MPVFLFAWANNGGIVDFRFVVCFVILHVLVYPASNGYNSYFDKDEGGIGGVKAPPKVEKQLYGISLVMDAVALLMAWWVSWLFALMVLIYGLVSKAYSHPSIRLKSKPIMGWLVVGIFQGYWTYLMTVLGLGEGHFSELFNLTYQVPAILSSALLLGSYPMTQIYQHEEDTKRGDKTISLLLGIRGTFLFTALFFTISIVAFFTYFFREYGLGVSLTFQVFLFPVFIFFVWWFLRSLRDLSNVNFDNTMRLNLVSATMLNAFFVYLAFVS